MTLQTSVILPQNDSVLLIRESIFQLVDFDHFAAVFVNQVIYWREKMGRQFYKTDQDFADELHISIHKFRRLKQETLAKFPFIKTSLKKIPARTHYELDIESLNNALAKLKLPAKAKNNHRLRKKAQTSLPSAEQTSVSKPAETITETKTEITKKTTTEKNPVVVSLDCFSDQEQPAAKKKLSNLNSSQQLAVLAVIQCAIQNSSIKNKIGYLHAVVKSVQDGTFTPAPPAKKVLTPEEKSQKKKADKIAEAQREQLVQQQYLQQQATYKKAQEQAGKKTESKPREKCPLSGLLNKMRG